MNKLLRILFSPRTTLGLLVIFAVAMGLATFIENSYDTETSKIVVYNAFWFEILMVLMALNFFGSIKRYQLLTWKKMGGFVFHISFVIMMIGAAVTRYAGFEGMMHIRQGKSTSHIVSSTKFLHVRVQEKGKEMNVSHPVGISQITSNYFDTSIATLSDNNIDIAYKNHLYNAQQMYVPSDQGGFAIIQIRVNDDGGHEHDITIRDGDVKMLHNVPVAFNNNKYPNSVNITGSIGNLKISFLGEITQKVIASKEISTLERGVYGAFNTKHSFAPKGTGLSIKLNSATANNRIKYVAGAKGQSGPNALVLEVSYKNKTQEVTLTGGAGYTDNFQEIPLEGIRLQLAYGVKKIQLPFSLQLDKFELDRYAGSMSPSSYASQVTLIDPANGVRQKHRIFMNNVLDYRGYRFFQSSYDKDEKGTVLSVNFDFWGTWITYFAYTLMILGFIWTLFNKHSRYWELMSKIKNLREKRNALTLFVIGVLMSTSITAQDNHKHQQNKEHEHVATSQFSVSETHATKFGALVTQTYEGRFAPIHTVAIDVIHKISKKDYVEIPGRGKISAVQLFLDMPLNPDFWKEQKLIYVSDQSINDVINVQGERVAFRDFFTPKGDYKLRKYAEESFRKPDGKRNKFDKEILKINERLEIFMMTFQGHMMDVFPIENSENNKWISWDDKIAGMELTSNIKFINEDLQLPFFSYSNIMRAYFISLIEATKTADYSKADKILGYIKSIQRQPSTLGLIPSEAKIDSEISYTNSNIFINLKNIYGLLSILLLVLAFIDNIRAKKSKIVSISLNVCIAALAAGFIYHTYGMGMRWYIAGHAPWSNGYEALVLISWSSLLAGFSFMRYSKITLAATALLAFFTLMTASHSSYDPQLTNLQPVLKSFWLIIHVAILTISYGFLGLGLILGLFNMVIYLIKTPKNEERLSLVSKELTYINEMNITIGLFLATVGTFLGGVWANESWGRYWGWDSKETWALVITVVYTIILHFRLAPKLKGEYIFNVASIVGFGSVLMTFIGVNYYFTKGMHSYGGGSTPNFPMWAWITIGSIVLLIVAAGIKEAKHRKTVEQK
ncbi:MAG: hypothetical protein COB98_11365 [Flavobacteriaceae bacterium]|nr:MAG: hypothetical protein COB98_11365 [Flavobacteriaceae bacterium]